VAEATAWASPGAGTGRERGLETAFERFGDAPALLHAGGVISHAELARRCDDLGDLLGATRRLVSVPMSNDLDSVVAYLGARRAGHVAMLVPADRPGTGPSWGDPDVELIPGPAGIEVVEHRGGTAHDLHEDLCLLLGTSGSTGSPKYVRLSGQNVTSNAAAIAEYLRLTPQDRAITALPLHYCYGLSVLHSHLLVGAGVVLTQTSVVDRCFWDLASSRGATSIPVVPHTLSLIDRVGADRLDLPALRRLTVAGGRASPAVVTRFAEMGERFGWDLVVMYGQTEATARMAYLPPHLAREHPGSIGVAIPGGSLGLVHRDGDPDDVGELVYRGPNVMMGYATEPADLSRGRDVDVLHTGDLARRGELGMFEIVGRANRMAKVFGERIDLDHLEARLDADGVAAWCVATDAGIGVLAAGAEPGEVRSRVVDMTRLPPGAVQVGRVGELPRHANGKPDRRGVETLLGADDPDGPGTGPSEVRDLLRRALGVEEVAAEDTFVTLGGDSLSYVEVSLGIEELLCHLPEAWHTLAVGELERMAAAAATTSVGDGGGRPAWRVVDTSVALRAVAVLLVVGSHVGVFRIRGGAHVLLAVAGFNSARFLLGADRPTPGADAARSIARIAVPASIWLAVLSVAGPGYGWPSVALLNSYLGPPHWSAAWRYWFVEALVISLVAAAAITTVPWVRRIDRRRPLAVPAALLGVALAARFDLVHLGATPEPLLAPHRVAWFFALGWFVARGRGTGPRLVASAVVLVAVPGFFGEPVRDAVVVAGLLALTWLPRVKLPSRLVAPMGLVAGASLYIYLCHYQVYPAILDRGLPPWAGLVASLAVGIGAWRAFEPAVERLVGAGSARIDSGRGLPGAAGLSRRRRPRGRPPRRR
jgi:acyl-CoA synthetase (AMP-forming)/AMP-acid ligase II